MSQNYKKKLIEVAIPLDAINAGSAYEKMPGIGAHPRGIHHWWARRPLVACRAVLFAQLVDDPSSNPDEFPTQELVEEERKRLFAIIENLVVWGNSNNASLLKEAQDEIKKSCGGELPPIFDPFSGGGSIPLEAQRLGLPAFGSDLNPVAVMIGKAMVEIPPKFAGKDPVHPEVKSRNHYVHSEGLAEDVVFYVNMTLELVRQKIGELYPQTTVSSEHGESSKNVIAWIWSRAVLSPDPAFSDTYVPLTSSFVLSSKKGREVWIQPDVNKQNKTINYNIRHGGNKDIITKARQGTKYGRGSNFRCLLSDTPITAEYIRNAAKTGNMREILIAIVADGKPGRIYLPPNQDHVQVIKNLKPHWKPQTTFDHNALGFRIGNYGMNTFGDMYTDRQLVALNTLTDTIASLKTVILKDAIASGMKDDDISLSEGGVGARAYAEAILIYLSFTIDRCADFNNSLTRWSSSNQKVMNLFGRQAIPMVWDFAEANILEKVVGGFQPAGHYIAKCIQTLSGKVPGFVSQNAAQNVKYPNNAVISTDPPYYDNIGYADLSDFFFSWMRPNLKDIYPDLFSVLATPKNEELVAAPNRHGGNHEAEEFFITGMTSTLNQMAQSSSSSIPATIYYAFKQSEIEKEGLSSTGWATFLRAVVDSGYSITGTWPMRTEQTYRMRGMGSNALANSVVLVCRKKEKTALVITRAEFIRTLKRELPPAIADLQAASIAPADMPQSAIGPGMGVFSRYKSVLESDDSDMSVKTALQLINRELDEFLNTVQGEFDADTRFGISWFEQHGYEPGEFGEANNIAQARGISVESVKHAGIISASAGKVKVLKRDELLDDWSPEDDTHLTIWECCQYLIRTLETDGEVEAAYLLKRIGPDKAESVKELAYCLYDICANKRSDAKEATSYNGLIAVWSELTRQAASLPLTRGDGQIAMDI